MSSPSNCRWQRGYWAGWHIYSCGSPKCCRKLYNWCESLSVLYCVQYTGYIVGMFSISGSLLTIHKYFMHRIWGLWLMLPGAVLSLLSTLGSRLYLRCPNMVQSIAYLRGVSHSSLLWNFQLLLCSLFFYLLYGEGSYDLHNDNVICIYIIYFL